MARLSLPDPDRDQYKRHLDDFAAALPIAEAIFVKAMGVHIGKLDTTPSDMTRLLAANTSNMAWQAAYMFIWARDNRVNEIDKAEQARIAGTDTNNDKGESP